MINSLPSTPKYQSSNWIADQQAKAERIEKYVTRGGGQMADDGSGDYQLDGFHFRSYPGREGYDESFLGPKVSLPRLDDSVAEQAAERLDEPGNRELEYTHFSIVQNKMRRMPFFTAVNIDGATSEVVHDKVKWAYEGRLPLQHQLGNVAYVKNDLDRGHLVHGQTPAWGPQGEQGRADTYNYANAGLQHKKLNQEEWLDLENQLLDGARDEKRKVSVFAGPVFSDSDRYFDNGGRIQPAVQMPQSYWKVIVWNDAEKGLQSESYLMSQAKDLSGESPDVRYEDGADLSPYRVPLAQLEELTHLHFPELHGTERRSRE